MKLVHRLSLPCALIAVGSVAFVLVLAKLSEATEDRFAELTEQSVELTRLLEEVRFSSLKVISGTNQFALAASFQHRGPSDEMRRMLVDVQDETDEEIIRLQSAVDGYDAFVRRYLLDEAQSLSAIRGAISKFVSASSRLALKAYNGQEAGNLLGFRAELEQAGGRLLDTASGALAIAENEYQRRKSILEERLENHTLIAVVGIFGVSVIGFVLALVSAKGVSGPIVAQIDLAQRFADGDFSARDVEDEQRGDEVGDLARALRKMAAEIEANIASRNKAQSELRDLNATLELRVEKRTRELYAEVEARRAAELEMARARDQANNANEAKSEFLTAMSHELRTPMNSIIGFSQLVSDDPRNPLCDDHNRFMNTILDNSYHLMDIINQVLDLAKIEAGKVEIECSDVAVAKVMEECATAAAPAAGQRGIGIETTNTDLSGQDIVCRAHEGQLRQVMLNLVSNAVKYNHDDGRVRISALETGVGMVRLSVEDTGVGIPEERLESVFEPFNRLGHESGVIEGTGVGLTIAKRLVELMGGRIGVDRNLHAGSTFWVELPSAVQDAGLSVPH